MWRRSLVLLIFCAWQACSAEQLVNLLEPKRGHALVDRDQSTYISFNKAYITSKPPIRPTKFRITMAAHVPPEEYPRRLQVDFQQMERIAFENGMYEATLDRVIDRSETRVRFDRTQKYFDVAEIELLGPREALDTLWSHGKYPCSERLASITPDNGLKKVFSRSKNVVPDDELRGVFKPNARGGTLFYYHGARPVIIGAVLPDWLPMVHLVSVGISPRRKGLGELVLEGHKCHPRSNTGECKGWERLASHVLTEWTHLKYTRFQLQVENPGEYKAYRVKLMPMRRSLGARANGKFIKVRSIDFEGCKV